MIHYDEGWNAYIDGIPYNPNATKDWKDGWKDCQSAKAEERVKI